MNKIPPTNQDMERAKEWAESITRHIPSPLPYYMLARCYLHALKQVDELADELKEQARIIGISGTTELKLRTRIEALEKVAEAARGVECYTTRLQPGDAIYDIQMALTNLDALDNAGKDEGGVG